MKLVLAAVLLSAWIAASAATPQRENPPPESAPSSSARPVLGQPFSATQYRRTLANPAGRSGNVQSDSRGVKVARDADGRIRIDKPAECCDIKMEVIFDPGAHTITPWLEGGRAAHEITHIALTEAQVSEVEVSQLPSEATSDLPGVSSSKSRTEDLGSDTIEGIPVTGVRTTVEVRVSTDNKEASVSRDVWTSKEMQLVLKIVTRMPGQPETIVGLEKISRTPDPTLFQFPTDYRVHENRDWRSAGGAIATVGEVPIR